MAAEETNSLDTTDGSGDSTYNESANGTATENAEEWVPPTRDEYEAVKAEKQRLINESVKRKNMLKENGIDLTTGKPIVKDESATTDDGDKVSRADLDTAISQAKARERRLTVETLAALDAAGWNGKNLGRILDKFLDLDAVGIEDDGITGLAEQVEELKRDVPEFFKRTRTIPPADAVGGGHRDAPASGKKDWRDKIREDWHAGRI